MTAKNRTLDQQNRNQPSFSARQNEEAIFELGNQFFDLAKKHKPSLLERQLNQTTELLSKPGNEDLLNAVMRFTDVLPQIKNDARSVRKHFLNYFYGLDTSRLDVFTRMGLWLAKMAKDHFKILDRLIALGARQMVTKMAKSFIAGNNAHSAVNQATAMAKKGWGFLGDLLQEAVTDEVSAENSVTLYEELLTKLAQNKELHTTMRENYTKNHFVPELHPDHQVDFQIALKLSSFYSQWDPLDFSGTYEVIEKRVGHLLRTVKNLEQQYQIKIGVTIDLEHFDYRDMTNEIFKKLMDKPEFRDMERIGLVVQAYLRDADNTIRDLAEWSRKRRETKGGKSIMIRLVKGAYWDYESIKSNQKGFDLPVFNEKWMSDANFERCVDLVLSRSQDLRLALASHNMRSLSYGLHQAQQLGIPLTVEMLYGMANNFKAALCEMGIPLFVYSPVGELLPGMAYLSRRILENASQNSFLRQSAGDPSPKRRQELLANPQMRPLTSQMNERSPQLTDLNQPFVNEAYTDFSSRVNQQKAQTEILKWQKKFTIENSFSPVDEAGVNALVQTAKQAFEKWQNTPAKERALVLLRAAQIMRQKRFELIAIMVLESHKPVAEADADVAEAIDFIEFYTRDFLKKLSDNPGLEFHSVGVAAVIMPWNFPAAIPVGNIVANLIAGNTVLFKPAEQSPLIGSHIIHIFLEAGLMPGVLNFVAGDGKTGVALVNHPEIQIINFVGSTSVGLAIYETAVPQEKTVVTEMGGKNAMIADADAHPDDVVLHALRSAFGYAGQKCSALDRLIVVGDENHFLETVTKLKSAASALKVGSPADFANKYGPVIDEESHKRIFKLISDFEQRKGKIILDGRSENNLFVRPTILEVEDLSDPVWREEFFAPILAVARAPRFKDAIRILNDCNRALTAEILTRDPAHQRPEVLAQIEAGNVYVDKPQVGAEVSNQPFGGWKLSGTGPQAGGKDYLWRFVKTTRKEDAEKISLEKIREQVQISTHQQMQPLRYNPDRLGEINRVYYRGKGHGVIFAGKDSDPRELLALTTAALHSGNTITVISGSETDVEAIALAEKTKWLAFVSKEDKPKHQELVKKATEKSLALKQGFARAIISETNYLVPMGSGENKLWALNPVCLDQMRHAQSRSENRARHSHAYIEEI